MRHSGGTRRALAAVQLAALLFVGVGASATVSRQPAAAASSAGVEAVEELARFFAVESVRRLRIPLLLRLVTPGGNDTPSKQQMIEEIERDPPRADADGVVYPFGDSNPLSFVYEPGTGGVSCWARLIKKRGAIGLWGITAPEMAAALNASTSPQRDRAGGDFAYDPLRDALSLRIRYPTPPTDRDRFYQDVDRLLAALRRMEDGRFSKKMEPISASRLPPPSATAWTDGFEATVLLRTFASEPDQLPFWVERYVRTWDRRPGAPAPRLVTDREVRVDQTILAFVHFRGARNGPDGKARVDATVRVAGPDGAAVVDRVVIPIWRDEAPPPDHLQIGINDLSLALDAEQTLGQHQVEVTVCDAVAERCVELVHPLALRAR